MSPVMRALSEAGSALASLRGPVSSRWLASSRPGRALLLGHQRRHLGREGDVRLILLVVVVRERMPVEVFSQATIQSRCWIR